MHRISVATVAYVSYSLIAEKCVYRTTLPRYKKMTNVKQRKNGGVVACAGEVTQSHKPLSDCSWQWEPKVEIQTVKLTP